MNVYFICNNYDDEYILIESAASTGRDCEAFFDVMDKQNSTLHYNDDEDRWEDEDGDEMEYFESSDWNVVEYSLERQS